MGDAWQHGVVVKEAIAHQAHLLVPLLTPVANCKA